MSDGFNIDVEVRYIERESDPEADRYVFAYTITISNRSDRSAQLMNRYWRITNAEGRAQEVEGPGVVGKQPVIEPGQSFRYTSAAVLETPVGSMEGHYEFSGDEDFIVPIPAFSLSLPKLVH
jgi:ApaG protein